MRGTLAIRLRAVLAGTIKEWRPFDRRGLIVGEDGLEYVIPNTRAFETVLPTMLRDLTGAKVSFSVSDSGLSPSAFISESATGSSSVLGGSAETLRRSHSPSRASTDQSVIRSRLGAPSLPGRTQAPAKVDLLAGVRFDNPPTSESTADGDVDKKKALGGSEEEKEDTLGHLPWQRSSRHQKKKLINVVAEEEETNAHPELEKPKSDDSSSCVQRVALGIIVDLASMPSRPGRGGTSSPYGDVVPPPSHLKDLRSSTLLSAHELSKVRKFAGGGGSDRFSTVTRKEAADKAAAAAAAAENNRAAASPEEVAVDTITTSSRLDPTSTATTTTTTSTGEEVSITSDQAASSSTSTTSPISDPLPVPHGVAAGAKETETTTMPPQTQSMTANPPAIVREVLDSVLTPVTGKIAAWSSLHRSGLIVEDSPKSNGDSSVALEEDAAVSVHPGDRVCLIRNVEAFLTAMPSSQNLIGRTVRFVRVKYSNFPEQTFAEDIIIEGPLAFSSHQIPTEADKKTAYEESRLRKGKLTSAMVFDEREAIKDIPDGPVYGIMTRWSGGQGTVEMAGGRTFFVASAADVLQLFDQNASGIRGAVVTFEVQRGNPRFAHKVNILSLSSRDIAGAKPFLPATAAATDDVAEPEGEGIEWVQGFMVSWSPAEEQGIIQGEDGERYLLKDARENVVRYNAHSRDILKRGRKVKFCRFGGSGLLACHVVPLDAEADEAALQEATLEAKANRISLDGHTDEAIASPLSTSYWMTKLEKAGFDMSELKNRNNMLIPPDLADDDDDPMLDTKDVLSKDRWFQDKDRNIKVPGSDVRLGDLAQMGPTAMINLAAKIRDPAKLEKMKNKYYNQLTEEMKEHAWKQAKEMAPRYGKRMREARERGEEPTFHFY